MIGSLYGNLQKCSLLGGTKPGRYRHAELVSASPGKTFFRFNRIKVKPGGTTRDLETSSG
jgi:hypothetical protein